MRRPAFDQDPSGVDARVLEQRHAAINEDLDVAPASETVMHDVKQV